jgi:hypothetical protein
MNGCKPMWLFMVGVACAGEGFASGCTCPAKPPALEALARSTAVFVGTVVSSRPAKDDSGSGLWPVARLVRFEVQSVFKGAIPPEASVLTGASGGDCGWPFEVGHTYLVYAVAGTAGNLATTLCTRTALLSRAGSDLAELGTPRTRFVREPAVDPIKLILIGVGGVLVGLSIRRRPSAADPRT